MVQIEATKEFVNRSLKDLNLRAKHNVHIIAIKKPAPNGSLLPSGRV